MKHQAQQQQSGASPILLPLLTTEFSFFYNLKSENKA
jgi:hypothetical protein